MPEETTPKKGRIRSWMDRNGIETADIVSVAGIVALGTAMTYLTYKTAKAIDEENDKISNWAEEQKAHGREIIHDEYGRVLAVDSYDVY